MGWFGKTQEGLNDLLLAAVKENDLAKVDKLIGKGASVNSAYEKDPLYTAIKNSSEEMVKYLLEHGANPNKQVGEDNTLLMMALESWRNMSDTMLKHGADPKLRAHNGASPFVKAIDMYRLGVAAVMIEKGIDYDIPEPGGSYPLHAAALRGDRSLATKMIEKGAQVNAQDKDGGTALHALAKSGGAAMALLLLEKGADASIADKEGKIAADYADKDFPALASVLRGEIPGQQQKQQQNFGDWILLAGDQVAHTPPQNAIGYRVTEIFNFSAHTYTQVLRNMQSGVESQSVSPFSAISEGTLVKQAHEALVQLGGQAPERGMEKKKLSQQGAMGAQG